MINLERSFIHTGIDYADAFNIKISRNKSENAYLAVFVCMAIKAIQLDKIVPDLSISAFLNTLK